MNAALKSAFAHAHRQTVVEFAGVVGEEGALLLWWMVGSSVSAGMEAVKGAVRAANAGVAGMVEMPVDGISLNVKKSLFGERKPRLGDLFYIGPAVEDGTAPHVPGCTKYACTGVNAVEIADHYHITGEKHA